ncbi:PucR family transcriptional regulator [Amycolatopsis jejuensis]|uniref:PucR family transcriptional regulator n=1 Tax=Amycolatopsis jejuensis TaxID=330084 RepID=UPI00068FF1EF|nr:helix-turn-helix domain-containing protein [Amycolatopsis jejuensis]
MVPPRASLPSVTTPSGSDLRRVLDALGGTLLDLVFGEPDAPGEIDGVAIHDPLEEPMLPRRSLVLGVGVRAPDEVARLLRLAREHGAVGLVARAPVSKSGEIAEAAAETGVALLEFARGASWSQLAAMLRSLLAEGDVGTADREMLGGLPSGDLFAVANAIAALLDAPITIEDPHSRVLAFSGRQDEADPSRVETILGRQVPVRLYRVLAERGIFRQLYGGRRPVFVALTAEEDGTGGEILPRVAVAVRAGDEVLGSIWAAVHEPLSEEREQALCDAARLVALHMLRIRAGTDVERRLRTELLSTALEGGAGAHDALTRLGLAGRPAVVLALAPAEIEKTEDDAALVTERQRLSDGLAMHLSAVHPRAVSALLGDVVYGLVPLADPDLKRDEAEQRVVGIANEFLDRVGRRVPAVVGIGPVAQEASALPEARACADRVLRVLRSGRGSGRRVARLADVHTESLLLELRDLVTARGDLPTGPVALLLDYDRRHHTNLVETLRAWLDAFGDVVAASTAMYVHPNTFRYRLRRLGEVAGLDLTDPEARFAAMLHLRVVAPEDPAND